jgi:ketosteroid isomerase-like protein
VRDKVAIAQAAADALFGGDIERALELLDPDVEWHGTVGGFDEGGVWSGRDAVVGQFTDYLEEWERLEMTAELFIDAGGDDVVVFFHERAKGRESGIEVETDTGVIQTIRDGRIARVRPFMDRAEALRAAELPRNVAAALRALEELPDVSDVWDPELEMINAAGWVIEATYRGREGVRRWWDDLADAFGEFEAIVMTVRAIEGERVLTTQRSVGSFRLTDIPFDAPWASIFTFRDGRIVRAEGFLNESRALRAAGVGQD